MGYDLDLGVLVDQLFVCFRMGPVSPLDFDNDRGLNPLEPRVTGADNVFIWVFFVGLYLIAPSFVTD